MRFEELAYTVDGQPVTVAFHARLTVMDLPAGEERARWLARLLGVLEGVRSGDAARLDFVDRTGKRIRLERDDQGGASLADLASGDELAYSAAHLSLDGRFDWFASAGIAARRGRDVIVVDPDAFAADDESRAEGEARLARARRLLARVEDRRQAATARSRRCGELSRRIAELDERVEGERSATSAPASEGPGAGTGELAELAAACCDAAGRRDELVGRLEAIRRSATTGGPGVTDGAEQAIVDRLVEEVEPAYADTLLAFADACRPFGVTLHAARVEAAGVGAAGVAALTSQMLAEVAARSPGVDAGSGRPSTLEAERSQLRDELRRTEGSLPDETVLARRRATLERVVEALTTSLHAGRPVATGKAEAILRGRAAAARRPGRCREPLPLVVDDSLHPFAPQDRRALLEVLLGLGETTQVVYLTDDDDSLAWASERVATGEMGLWRPDRIAVAPRG